jgi:hypothetical protein
VAVLDPDAIPGLSVGGGGTLKVNGRVVINSQGRGYDENNQVVDLGFPSYAASTSNGSLLQASRIDVVGGVDVPANFQNLPGTTGNPLHARALIEPDNLVNLPTPTTGNGVVNTFWQRDNNGTWTTASQPQDVAVSISNNETVTFSPGVYKSITVTGGGPGTVTFLPGIYVIGANFQGGGDSLKITSGATVVGNGVMFYNTGSDYVATSGLPDANDGDALGTVANNVNFGSVNISAAQLNLIGIQNTGSVFNGMLFYQRRWNTKTISIQGNSQQSSLGGTLYAKWANFKVTGQGTYAAQFVAGSLAVSGQADITIDFVSTNLGRANQVFLVE